MVEPTSPKLRRLQTNCKCVCRCKYGCWCLCVPPGSAFIKCSCKKDCECICKGECRCKEICECICLCMYDTKTCTGNNNELCFGCVNCGNKEGLQEGFFDLYKRRNTNAIYLRHERKSSKSYYHWTLARSYLIGVAKAKYHKKMNFK